MMPHAAAPVVLFAYNRPLHVSRCLESLADCRNGSLARVVAFVDGPRTDADTEKVRNVVATIGSFSDRFAKLDIVQRASNFGLARNVIDGVSTVVGTFGRVIVLEDDMVVSRGFLDYMNRFLDLYADTSRVGSIHGFSMADMDLGTPFYFMRGGDCWGWATWKDRWDLFEPDGRKLLDSIVRQHLLESFTLGHTAPYCRLLCRQILGLNNSWAIRWHATLFLADRLTLYPTRSLVQNIGLDGSGENCGDIRGYDTLLSDFDENDSPPSALGQDEFAERHFSAVYLPGKSRSIALAKRLGSRAIDWSYICRVKWSR